VIPLSEFAAMHVNLVNKVWLIIKKYKKSLFFQCSKVLCTSHFVARLLLQIKVQLRQT